MSLKALEDKLNKKKKQKPQVQFPLLTKIIERKRPFLELSTELIRRTPRKDLNVHSISPKRKTPSYIQ